MDFSVVQGNVAGQEADILVNAAGASRREVRVIAYSEQAYRTVTTVANRVR